MSPSLELQRGAFREGACYAVHAQLSSLVGLSMHVIMQMAPKEAGAHEQKVHVKEMYRCAEGA